MTNRRRNHPPGWAPPAMRSGGQGPPCSRTEHGFTLLEVLAAIVLVGIVVPVAMEAISLSMRSASDAKRKVEAAMLAENKLTELATGLVMQSTTGTTAGGGVMPSGGAMSGDFAPDWRDYRWEATRVEREVDLSELQVRVTWLSRGADRHVSLSTFVYTGVAAEAESTGLEGAP